MTRGFYVSIVAVTGCLGLGVVPQAHAPEAARPTIAATQAADATPTLTTEQKQAIQILALRMENAQQAARIADAAFAAASTELSALVRTLRREGYELDLQTLTYAKSAPAPTPKKDEPKKEPPAQ